jgi:hypothetical protein
MAITKDSERTARTLLGEGVTNDEQLSGDPSGEIDGDDGDDGQ